MHSQFDVSKFVNPSQVGGIDAYTIDEGEARGVRVLCVNTGGGLRYRILVDRGMDIDQAFYNQLSLSTLAHKGVTPPTRALDRGLDWLKGFPIGLLTTCGPFNIGSPALDNGEELGLHGPHSNTAASVESVIQPDPRCGRLEMSVTGVMRYGRFFGPNVELRRTIRSVLGENVISITDEFFNAGNRDVPHAWLLHINLGYPLADEGAELCYDAAVEPRDDPSSQAYFKKRKYKQVPAPLAEHDGNGEALLYLQPKADRNGRATIGLVNRQRGYGVAIRYSTRQFPRCANCMHWGRHEYVAALEPMNGTVDGRDQDRARGVMDTLKAGQRKTYDYEIAVATKKEELSELIALNAQPNKVRRR